MMNRIIRGFRTSAVIAALAVVSMSVAVADTIDQQLTCLAKNIYFEARGEPLRGQMAVAWVTLNRVESGSFSNTICGVVNQPGQFSWTTDGHSNTPRDSDSWNRALTLATLVYAVYDIDSMDPTDGSTYFSTGRHPNGIKIGAHVFYKTP